MSTYTKKYNPDRSSEWNYGGPKWKLSRSKIDFFLECPRCFYLDNKLGTKRPSMPSFNLNIAVDELFKKEFDTFRIDKKKHPIMDEYGIDAIPFAHKDLDIWRDPFLGITHIHKSTGLIVSGAIDDIWQLADGTVAVVDYKATSKEGKIESLSDSAWEDQYKRQIGVYQWLFTQNGFEVNKTGYFVYANALQTEEKFENKLIFDTTLIACEGDQSWIEPTLEKIKNCLESDIYPESNSNCEYCAYRKACGEKLQRIHSKSATLKEPSTPMDTINALKNKYK
jgi:CRISPR/Cas system-associated exonuclease Cas4 (RecB family)